jgi:predicted lipoprotein with Yx(FWY)xxD motif
MNRFPNPTRARILGGMVAVVAGVGGFATAALVGVALAKTFSLTVAKHAKVTDQAGTTKTRSIVVTTHGFAVYTLSGDSKRHPKCTKANGCFGFWPPVTVASTKKLSKAPGIHGKLGVWHRNGSLQVTLAGHPLYRYAGDSQRDHATGEGIHTFGGTWHVVKAAGSSGTGTTTPTSTTTSTTTTTCLYPPCY